MDWHGTKADRVKGPGVIMQTKPNFVDVDNPNEVKIYARNLEKTGSKQLHTFSMKRGLLAVGDVFQSAGQLYKVERINHA